MVRGVTYKQSGVDITEANKFVKDITGLVRSTFRPEVLADLGGFGGCFALHKDKYKNPILVSSTDGVGTKLKVAILMNKHNTIGIDLVGMNVNDILAMGAEPLFFLDYIACGKVSRDKLVDIVHGIVKGCKESGCSLIAGETAEMPGIYKEDEYDLAGFCVGIVEKDKIVDGSKVRLGDKLVGIESNGLHSNGYSLVRKIFSESEIKGLSKELLRPTRIYVKPVLSLRKKVDIHGIAHITGGAFYEKLVRILPKGLSLFLKKGSWPIPDIFQSIQGRGNVEDKEMFRTFNMGIGMVLAIKDEDVTAVRNHLEHYKMRSWVIGEVVRRGPKIEIVEGR